MKKLFSLVLLILISSFINSQEYKKVEAEKIMQGTEHIYYNSNKTFPTYIKFSSDISKSIDQILSEWQKNYNLSYKLLNVEKDLLGFEHYKYQQYYDTIPVEWAIFKIHVKNEKVESYSGTIWLNLQAKTNPVISKNKAIEIAIIRCV